MGAPQMGLNAIDTNQQSGFGGFSHKQSYGQTQGFGHSQMQKEIPQDENNELGLQNEESMGSYGNPMTGGYQMQGGFGYNNYGGNQGSFGGNQGGYGGQHYDPQGNY